jgi:BirA family transcriptional regulator, biotin operon repressor / biotin---[acetyl-CoA-carboxylase] ligase
LLPATPNIILGEPFIELTSIDSTNIYAMELVHKGLALSGSCIRAHFQTQGKGQHGRNWESSAGLNLLCSYILELKQLKTGKIWTPADQIGFSAAVALGARAFFASFAGAETKIKKPNDIYWGDRKAGGILIENVVRGQAWTWSVVGIGINIHQMDFSNEAGNPISLKQITQENFELNILQKELSQHLIEALTNWIKMGEVATLEKLEAQSVIIKK